MTATIYAADGVTPIETPKDYRLVPEAGKIIVARAKVDPYLRLNGELIIGLNGEPLPKHSDKVDEEEERNTVAVVVSVGDPDPNNGYVGTWRTGQRVVIQPHVFNEAPGLPEIDGMVALIGSFYGITARWEEVKDDEF